MNLFNRLSVTLLIFGVIGLPGCSRRSRLESQLARGLHEFKAGKYDDAEVIYRSVLQKSPGNAAAIRQLALIYFEEGRLAAAVPFVVAAARLGTGDTDIQLKLASLQLLAGQAEEARTAVEHILEKEPAGQSAAILLVSSAQDEKERTAVESWLRQLQRKSGDFASFHVGFAQLRLRQTNTPAAIEESRRALALDPKSRDAWLILANAFLITGDAKEAESAFKSAMALAPVRSAERTRFVGFLLLQRREKEAKTEIDRLIAEAPDFIPARVLKMKMAFAQHQYADCSKELDVILARDPRNYDGLVHSGRVRLAERDFDGAMSRLDEAEAVAPRSAEVKYERALVWYAKNDTVRAEVEVNRALSLAPRYDSAELFLATLKLRHNDAAAAIGLSTAVLSRAPDNEQAYLLLAQAYEVNKDPSHALATYRAAIQRFPKDPGLFHSLGVVLMSQGHAAEARAAFETAVARNPTHTAAQEALLDLDLAENQTASARDRVATFLKSNPTSVFGWLLSAKIHWALREFGSAEADLRRAVSIDPSSETAVFLLVQVLTAEQKTSEALQALDTFIGSKRSPSALFQAAQLCSGLHDNERAKKCYEQGLQEDPRSAAALNNLAYIYAQNPRQLDRAAALAKRAIDLEPANPSILDTEGWINFRRGEYRTALSQLLQGSEKSPGDPNIQYHLGMTYYMLGEEESARAALGRADSDRLQPPERSEVRHRLNVIGLDPSKASAAEVAALEQELASSPADPVVRTKLAEIAESKGHSSEASAHWEVLLKTAPQNPAIMLRLIRLYDGVLPNPARANELARKAHQIAPLDYRVSHALGRILQRSGDFSWSANLLDEAQRHLPDDVGLAIEAAEAKYNIAAFGEAEEILATVLRTHGDSTRREEVEHLLALVSATKRDFATAEIADQANRILLGRHGYIPALMVSGLARESAGNFDGALECYEAIVAAAPLFSPAVRHLMVLYLQRISDDDKAYDLLVKAKSLLPNDPQIDRCAGIVLYRRGEYAAAAKALQLSLSRAPTDAEVLYYLGMCHFRMKENSLSQMELQRALSLELPRDEADEAHKVLERLKQDMEVPRLTDPS